MNKLIYNTVIVVLWVLPPALALIFSSVTDGIIAVILTCICLVLLQRVGAWLLVKYKPSPRWYDGSILLIPIIPAAIVLACLTIKHFLKPN